MYKNCVKVCFIIIIFFSFVHLSFAEYAIVQITDNEFDDSAPRINNSGMITWYGNDGNDDEIFLYDGTTINQITNNNYQDTWPNMNDSGEIVWSGVGHDILFDWQVYLYDGATTTNLSSGGDNWEPKINNRGEMIWLYEGDTRWWIIFYDRITETTISRAECNSANINDNGEVVYECLNAVILWDGTENIQITESELTIDEGPLIGNNGDVVWRRFDGNDYEIFLYDSTNIIQLTDNDFDDYSYQINDHGNIVWSGDEGYDSEIFYYDGTTITQLTDNDLDDTSPKINSYNTVVWKAYDGDDYEIFIYNGTTITQLTDNDLDDTSPQINNRGQVVWQGENDTEIFLATPVNADDDDGGGGGGSGDSGCFIDTLRY